MSHINISEMENNVKEYLNRAESGEPVVITRDGKAVFELKYIGSKKALDHTEEENLMYTDFPAPSSTGESEKPRKRSATALFGMLKHRKRQTPVSIEEMEQAIQDRRRERATK